MINFSIYTIFTLYCAYAASFLEGDWFQVLVLIYLSILFIYKQKKIDNEILIFFELWICVNVLALLLNRGDEFSLLTLLSVTARMLFPYLMIKIVGPTFFKGLFKYWFFLCLLGFPFYLLELAAPDFVQSLAPRLNFMTQRLQTSLGGFYLFFYMHNYYSATSYNVTNILRNSGFLWEPGAYSLVLIFMIVYNLLYNNYKVNWKTIFLIICLFTTFSTSGYLAFFFIIFFYLFKNDKFYKNHKAILPVLVIVTLFAGITFYSSVDFMSNKINRYIEAGTNTYMFESKEYNIFRTSRLGIAIMSIENSLQDPWGDGVVVSDYMIDKYHNPQGPNSLAIILQQWGWIGLLVLFYCLYMFKVRGERCGLLLMIPLSFPLFSNPFTFMILIYAIVFSVLCIPEMKYEIEIEDDKN